MSEQTTSAEAGNAGTEQSASSEQAIYSGLPQGQPPDPMAALMERLRSKFGENPSDALPDGGEGAGEPQGTGDSGGEANQTGDQGDSAGEKPEGAAAKPEEVKPDDAKTSEEKPETTAAEDLQHARALRDLRKTQGENVTLKKRAETAEARWAAWEKRFKEGNPLEALEEIRGQSFKEIIEQAREGKFDKKEKVELPPEVQAELDYAKERRLREEKEAQAAKRNSDKAADLPKVKQFLDARGDNFPIFASFDTAAEDLVDLIYDRMDENDGNPPNIVELCKELEGAAAKNFGEFFTNKKLIKHMATSNPQIRASLLDALGITEQKPAGPASGSQGDNKQQRSTATTQRVEAPRTVATETEIPTRVEREPTEDELRAESVRLLQQARASGRFQ